jgi:type IV secretion system protein VirD4
MTFIDDFRRGWSEGGPAPGPGFAFEGNRGAAAAGSRRTWPAAGGPGPSVGRIPRPSPIRLGYYFDRETGETGGPLPLDSSLHTLVVGANGAGKQTRLLTELYMTVSARSLFVFDVKGTAALQTAEERRRLYGVDSTKIICPYPVLGLPNDGHNPLAHIDHRSKHFYADCRAVMDAIIDAEEGKNEHWSESASDFGTAGTMFEVELAHRQGRIPSLLNVRMMLTQPDRWEPIPGRPGKQRLVAGIKYTAARMIAEGGPIIASLIAPFMRDKGGEDELAGIASTFRRNMAFVLDPHIAETLSVKNGADFRKLRDWPPKSVYCVLPPDKISQNRRFTRLMLSSAMRAHFRPGEIGTLFVMDEFRLTVGDLPIVREVWAVVREYAMQLMPVVQTLVQLKSLFGDEWETFVGQAGCVVTIGPASDHFTADWMSKRCGSTTLLQRGFNLADGVNSGDGANSGFGYSNGGGSSNQGSNRNYGRNISGTFSVQQVERPAFLPQELMNLRPGQGRAWPLGMGGRSIPLFLPNYWNREADWVRRVKPNPYYSG